MRLPRKLKNSVGVATTLIMLCPQQFVWAQGTAHGADFLRPMAKQERSENVSFGDITVMEEHAVGAAGLDHQIRQAFRELQEAAGMTGVSLTEQETDIMLELAGKADQEELAVLRADAKRLLGGRLQGDIPRIYFVPSGGMYLWEVDGRYAAAHFSRNRNAVYINLNFLKYLKENLIQPGGLSRAISVLSYHEMQRISGRTHYETVKETEKLSHELHMLYYRAKFLQIAKKNFVPSRRRIENPWTWEQISKIPGALNAVYGYCKRNSIPIKEVLDINLARQNGNVEMQQIISEILGREGTTLSALSARLVSRKNGGKNLGVSWNDILRAAGIDPYETRRSAKWTKEQDTRLPIALAALFRYCEENKINAATFLNPKAFPLIKDPAVTELISDAVEREEVTPGSLYMRSYVVYGSWDKAVEAAGYEPPWNTRWTEEQTAKIENAIIAVYCYCLDHEIPVSDVFSYRAFKENHKTLKENGNVFAEITKIMSQEIGRNGTDLQSLNNNVRKQKKYNHEWYSALEIAGVNLKEVRERALPWTPEQKRKIPEAIKMLDDIGVAVNSGEIQFYGPAHPATEIIAEVLGREGVTGKTLHQYVWHYMKDEYPDGWNSVLQAAGCDLEKVRKYNYWTKDQETKMLHAMKAVYEYCVGHKIDPSEVLGARAIRKNLDPAIAAIISVSLDRPGTTANALYWHAISMAQYGFNWAKPLKDAGLPVAEILKNDFPFISGRISYWRGIRFRSIMERDTAVILSVANLIKDPEPGRSFEVPFKKSTTSREGSVDFYCKKENINAIFEPHGSSLDQLDIYEARRQLEYQGTWAAGVPNKFFFDNTGVLKGEMLPKILGRELTLDELAEIDRLIEESEVETRQHKETTAEPKAELPELGHLSPGLSIALQAI